MAHDKGEPTRGAYDSDSSSDQSNETKSLINRRSYLKLGAAAAAMTSAGALASAADESDVDGQNIVDAGADSNGEERIDGVLNDVAEDGATIYFPEGRYLVEDFGLSYRDLTLVGDGATIVPTDRGSKSTWGFRGNGTHISGFVFDYSDVDWAPMIQIREPGTSRPFKLSECYFQGVQSTGGSTSSSLRPEVSDSSGEGIVEDCYFPDGAAEPSSDDNRRAVLVEEAHEGTLTFRRCWFEHWAENTLYIRGGRGDIVVEDSFLRNTNAGVRCGGNTTLRGCVVVLDGNTPAESRTNSSAMWFPRIDGGARHSNDRGDVVIEDCDLHYTEGSVGGQPIRSRNPPDDGSPIVVRNTRIRTDNRTAIWVEDRSGTTNMELSNVHVTHNDGGNAIQVDNSSADVSVEGLRVNSSGSVSNRGNIADAASGDPTAPDTTPPMPTPEEFLEGKRAGDDPQNSITLSGNSNEDETGNYRFSVSGALQNWDADDATVDDSTTIEGSTAEGSVTTDSDAFKFSGDITDFAVAGPVTVQLNGESISVDSVVEAKDSFMTLHNVSDAPYEFEFAVTGEAEKSDAYDAPIDENDEITESGDLTHVSGTVGANSKKSFNFTGALEAFTHTASGDASRLWVNSEEYDAQSIVGTGHELPDTTLDDGSSDGSDDGSTDGSTDDGSTDDGSNDGGSSDDGTDDGGSNDGSTDDGSTDGSTDDGSTDDAMTNTIVIEGQPNDVSRYTFEVSGEIEQSDELGSANPTDIVGGNSAEGYVYNNDVDAFHFSGELTGFQLQGSATVKFQDGALDGQ